MNNVSIKIGNLFDKDFSERTIYRQEIANMFKIVRFPSKLKSFFDSLQNQFHFNHFEYFQTLVLLIAFSWGRRNISSYGSCLLRHRRKKTCRINKTKGYVKYTYVDAGWLEVSDLGKLHVLFSRKNGQQKAMGLVTDDLTDYLKQFSSGTKIVKERERLLIAA